MKLIYQVSKSFIISITENNIKDRRKPKQRAQLRQGLPINLHTWKTDMHQKDYSAG